MNCLHASRLLSQAQERRLPLRSRLGLRWHLLLCAACARFSQQLVLLRQAVRHLAAGIEADEKLGLSVAGRQRIATAVDGRRQEMDAGQQNPDQYFSD